MRRSSMLSLVFLLAIAAGQRPVSGRSGSAMRSGPPTLSLGNPFTGPSSHSGARPLGSWPGNLWSRPPAIPTPVLWFYSPPIFTTPTSLPPVYPPYGIGQTDFYQGFSQPLAVPSPTVPPPQLPDFDSPLNALNQSDSDRLKQSQADNANRPGDTSAAAENFRMVTSQCSAPIDEYHPPIIALKTHGAYSASNYWTEGKTFHFVTTQGEHLRVPVSLVERIYPGSGHETSH